MIVRRASGGDAAAVAAIYAPYVEATPITFEVAPPSADEMRGRIEAGAGLYPWLVAEVDGAVAGYAYATAFRPRPAYRYAVEVTAYLAQGQEGRGYGKALYARLLPLLEAQGFTQAMAAITLPNAASLRLHESAGFARAGVYAQVGWKCGAWHDVGLWQRPLAPASTPPGEPRAVAEVWDG